MWKLQCGVINHSAELASVPLWVMCRPRLNSGALHTGIIRGFAAVPVHAVVDVRECLKVEFLDALFMSS